MWTILYELFEDIMFNLPFIKNKQVSILPNKNGKKPIVLLVLDGWGIAPPSKGNPISRAKTPNFNAIYANYPHGQLIASGESVGLPANEVGNSEVGHLTIGVGKVILQSLKRINVAIEEGTFYENNAFTSAIAHVRQYKSKLHLMGLISSGSVHASADHFNALLEFCRRSELNNVCIHIFTDGRDAPPKEAYNLIKGIEKNIDNLKIGKIATITGRYYAMDRDMRWSRTQRAYEAIVAGKGLTASSPEEAIKNAYIKGQTDEFIEPTVIVHPGNNKCTVDDDDAVIFFNFRVDRPRQLTMAFVLADFENLKSFEIGHEPGEGKKEGYVYSGSTFKRIKWPKNLYFVTMTEYQEKIPVSAIAYPPIKASTSLPEVLAKQGKKQLHLTESEKERMVTIYFNGLHGDRFPGEDDLILPSPKVSTYDKKPEMNVFKIVEEFKKALTKNIYDFVVMNFANPDMVAHSGSIKATIKAIEYVDKAVGEVVQTILAYDGTLFITADHGNAEELISFPTTSFFFTTSKGNINTDHSNNPVPFLIIANRFYHKPFELTKGNLSDVAPTILSYMSLPIPLSMAGKNLLVDLKNTATLESRMN